MTKVELVELIVVGTSEMGIYICTVIVVSTWEVWTYWNCCWYVGDGGPVVIIVST